MGAVTLYFFRRRYFPCLSSQALIDKLEVGDRHTNNTIHEVGEEVITPREFPSCSENHIFPLESEVRN